MFWPVFWTLVIAVGLFGEAVGLWRSAQGDTLSEQVWYVCRLCPFLRFVVPSVLVWCAIHFATLGVYAGWRTFGGWMLATVGLYLLVGVLK